MVLRDTQLGKWFILFLGIVLLSNVLLYQPLIQQTLSFEIERGIVLGSLVDLVIVAPALAYLAINMTKKKIIGLMILGLVAAKLLIPQEFFTSFTVLLYGGIALEGMFLIGEVSFIINVVRKIPEIRREMNISSVGPIFSMLPAAEKKLNKHPLIPILVSEALMFYYAFFTWGQKPPEHDGTVTFHKKTSAIPLNLMLIHAILIETMGIHYWLHSKLPILSLIFLLLNIYSIILFLAELQITRLQPLEVKDNHLYVAQGIMQRVCIPLENIEKVDWGQKPSKEAILFMHKDFEKMEPQVILYFSEPVEVTLFMGRKKMTTEVALRVDEPEKLKKLLLRNQSLDGFR